MKLRYYMRGLGIGILVTAILMGVTIDGKTEKLSDAEIIARAEALGMEKKYESTVLSDTVPEGVSENETDEEAVPEEDVVDDAAVEEVAVEEAAAEEESVVADEQKEDVPVMEIIKETPGEDVKEQLSPEEETEQTVQITVQGGDGSQTVARKLAEAGLVEDAKEYDKYLCSNGYDKRICTGTHTIPVGAGEEEIAKIITSRP